ncbi:efflux RND transporter periplasmic adaptor subunit [Mesorhizobium sp. SARCC-RB16n]|uniref:efflux RND transporter periplasmic adaptor subunit n=1 Tax=Mesorhizobium sp. SARCC-RB16n TaxID=2116687 RepID=UPI00122F5341|nr:efflux RND transporter periplasmic adaptor subunit [Mesorhizobium sp. SARCC-RB16n]KAA3450311.1 efflux RND transporter periplasmic adaptor subunit [Mesorhizobium sp. SARCC-RB16n]
MQLFRPTVFAFAWLFSAGANAAGSTALPQQVRAVGVSQTHYQPGAEITGEVKARIQTDLSFRTGGKVIERRVDVGSHVRKGEILARIDNTEQLADVGIAQAGLDSAKATLEQKTLAFNRYEALLRTQAVARATYDQAQNDLLTAQASLQLAEASLATALDAFSYTELKADADGVITSRNIEIGQVVSAAQAAFALAHDGPRDAVFNVFEAFFLEGRPAVDVDIAPIGDRTRKAQAIIGEISPTIDTKAGTVRVKVALPESADWPLGTPVVGEFRAPPQEGIILPSSAMASDGGEPAVWVIDRKNSSVSMRKITVARYRTKDFIVTDGIRPEDLVVIEGGKFLEDGRVVAWENKS